MGFGNISSARSLFMRRRPGKASCTVDTTRANVLCTSQRVESNAGVGKAASTPSTPSTPGPTDYLSFRDIGMPPPSSSSANKRFSKAIEALNCTTHRETSPELRSTRRITLDEHETYSRSDPLCQQLDHEQPRASYKLKSVPRRKSTIERVPTFVLELAEGSCEIADLGQQPQDEGRLSPPNVDHQRKAKVVRERNPRVPTLELEEVSQDCDFDTTVKSSFDDKRLSPPLVDCRIKAVMV